MDNITGIFPDTSGSGSLKNSTITIRRIVEENFEFDELLVGATRAADDITEGCECINILNREFSYVTPENDIKQSRFHPEPEVWNFAAPDAWISHIEENDQVLRWHGPIGPQASDWAKAEERTAEELEGVMIDHLKAICQRYYHDQRVIAMDVVNEVVTEGNWHNYDPGRNWTNPWSRIGYDENNTPLFIKYAFETATEYARDDVKLIFNHHECPSHTASWDLIKETIHYLRDLDLRVDGIGWQAHEDVGWEKEPGNINALYDLIDWAHDNDLEFHVTEKSVWLESDDHKSLEAQADTYRAVMEVMVEKSSDGPMRWNTWSISDAGGWQTDKYPYLWDSNYKPKPAYLAVLDTLNAGISEPDDFQV